MLFGFSKNNILINSNWIANHGGNYISNEGGEKLLATYLNLYRFVRCDFNNYKSGIYFVCNIEMIYKAMVEHKRICKMSDVYDYLNELVKLKVIEIKSQSGKYLDPSKTNEKELLVIKDNNYNNCEHYIYTPLDVIKYMLDHNLTYRHVSVFLLMMKWTNNPEKHCYVSLEKMASWLGYSNKSVLKYVREMNKLGVVVSNKKKSSLNRDCYYHTPIRKLEYVNGK